MARLILFDIDMTLITTTGAGRTAIGTAFGRLYGIEKPTDGVSFDGRTDHAIFTEIIQKHRLANGDLEAVYRKATEAYLAELPNSLASKAGTVLPGVPELLAALGESRGGIGLATGNSRRGARVKLSYFGLWERFAGGGFGDVTPIRAEVVRAGMEELAGILELDANPFDTIVLGDTPLDVDAAHKAGTRALAVATGKFTVAELEASGAEWVMEDLADTSRVLEILGS